MATGMQLILWHDSANGRRMRWSAPMQEQEGVAAVDIAAEMKQALRASDEDYSNE